MATDTGPRTPTARRPLVVAASAALALGVVAGLGSWRIGLHAHRSGWTTTATRGQPQVQQQAGRQASTLPSSAPPPTSGAGLPASTTTVPAASTAPPQQTIVLVATQAQADVLEQAQGLENTRRLQFGEPLVQERVIVVTSPEQEAMLRRGAAAVGDIAPGQPPVIVIDLRAPAPSPSPSHE